MATKLTDADIEDFVRRHRAGETLDQLMAAFHVGHPRATAILAAHGEKAVSNGVRTRKLTDGQIAELVQRYEAGASTPELGPVFGISAASAYAYLIRADAKMRSRHDVLQLALDAMDPEVLYQRRSEAARRSWQSYSPEKRASIVSPANAAARGSARTLEQKIRAAQAREARGGPDSEYEARVAGWLTERDVPFIHQKAVGPYNLDFAVGNVGIEVTTGWARKKEWRERFAYLFDQGWHLYVIWHDNTSLKGGRVLCELLPCVADDFVAWKQILEVSPSLRCQHRVIRRSRQISSTGSGNADYVASIFKTSRPFGRWALYEGPGNYAQGA